MLTIIIFECNYNRSEVSFSKIVLDQQETISSPSLLGFRSFLRQNSPLRCFKAIFLFPSLTKSDAFQIFRASENMSDSPKHSSLSDKDQAPQVQRPCDYCGDSTALLYCRADSAKLCFSCDREVHSTNQLFSKHTRTQLCDACDDSPATILCSTECSVLCQNCDWERHNLSLSSVHDRRPLEGFTGCPSVTELLTILGFEYLGKKDLFSTQDCGGCGGGGGGLLGSELEEGLSDLLVWDAPAVVSLDDLITSTSSSHNYQAMEVPPLPKVYVDG